MIEAIRSDQPINDTKTGAESTLTAILGREAAYSGQPVEWDQIRRAQLDLAPPRIEVGDVPVPPVPRPGLYRLI